MEGSADWTRDQLATEILERIYCDQQRTSAAEVRKLLAYFRDHLFDPTLNVTRAYKRCGIRSSYFPQKFREALGETPKAYLQCRRIEVGEELLIHTTLDVYDIGNLVGFGTGQAFSLAFRQTKGEPPSVFRKRLQKGAESQLPPQLLEQTRSLAPNEVEHLQNFLLERYPEIPSRRPPLQFTTFNEKIHSNKSRGVTLEELETLLAQQLWSDIQGLDLPRQQARICRERFKTPALFEFLRSKTVAEGRKSRVRGLEIAWLALEAANISEHLRNGRGILRARAWAWICNSQRLNLDFKEAERSIRLAEMYIPETADPLVVAEVLESKAALRWYQARLEKALAIEDKAIKLFKEANFREGLARACMVRGNLLANLNRIPEAIETYHEVRMILAPSLDAEMSCAVTYNLARCLYRNGDLEAARRILKPLKERVRAGTFELLRYFIESLEGRISLEQRSLDEAARRLESARQGFSLMDSKLSSIVGVDIAVTYYRQGKVDACIEVLSLSLSALSAWREKPAFDKVYRKLERSLGSNILDLEDLLELQTLCDDLGSQPEALSKIGLKGMI